MLIAAFMSLFLQVQEEPPTLTVGQEVTAEISESHPTATSEILRQDFANSKKWRQRFRITPDRTGPYYFQLRSPDFDSYLLLRDASKKVLLEDDDGWFGAHSQIVCEQLQGGDTYYLDVCALREVGLFHIQFHYGEPTPMSYELSAKLALDDARNALQSARLSHGLESLAVAGRLENLGALLREQGLVQQAKLPLHEAYSIRQKMQAESHPRRIRAAHKLARCLAACGDLNEAQKLFRIALQGWQQINGQDHESAASCAGSLAEVLRRLGEFREARRLYQWAIPILEKTAAEDLYIFASHLNGYALLLSDQGMNAQARVEFERVLAIDEQILPENHPDLASAKNNLATVLHQQGLYSAARDLYEQTLNARLQADFIDQHLIAQIHINMGILDIDEGKVEDARKHYEQAMEIDEQLYGPEHLITSFALSGMGQLWLREKLYDEAIEFFQRARRAREIGFGPDHSSTLSAMRELANALRLKGDLVQARDLLDQAIALNEKSASKSTGGTGSMHAEMAFLLADLGQLRAAWDELKTSMAIQRQGLTSRLAALSEAERFQSLAALEGSMHMLVNLATQLGDEQIHAQTLAEVLSWKGLSSRLMISSRKRLLASMSAQSADQLNELRGLQTMISTRLFAPPSGNSDQELAELAGLQERRNQIELSLQREAGFGVGAELPNIAVLRQQLPADTAFLSFFEHNSYAFPEPGGGAPNAKKGWQPSIISAWILSSSGLTTVELGSAELMAKEIRSFKEYLVTYRGGRALPTKDNPRRTELLDRLWQPLVPHLENANFILVSPSSFLGGVPLEVLEHADGTFLIEKYRFVYAQDVPSLLQNFHQTKQPTTGNGLLVVGDVDYFADLKKDSGNEATQDLANNFSAIDGPLAYSRGGGFQTWHRLAGTQYESDSIHFLHHRNFGKEPNRVLLNRAKASEQEIKAQMPGKHFLHFATHGFFQPEGLPSMWTAAKSQDQLQIELGEARGRLVGIHPGYLAGLVCAGANQADPNLIEDGYLTAEEVAWLDLGDTDMVVLSACQTGLGQPQGAEGMISLSRAFHLAGARTVIASLWSIKDYPATDLMLAFYENLWQHKMGKLEALRAAQLQMLASNRRKNHGDGLPSTWGAFVLSGEWR